MNDVQSETPSNPALELVDLIEEWAEVPANQTPLAARGGQDYWPHHSRANQLLDSVADYVSERALLTGRRRVPGTDRIQELRVGINSPGYGLTHAQGSTWQAIGPDELDWLEGIGQQWDRRKLAPHQSELRTIIDVTRQIADILTEADDESLDSMHRDYMLEVCDALQAAARDADIYGEPATARLAFELIGTLEGFLPAGSDETKKNLYQRLKSATQDLLVTLGAKTVKELVTSPGVVKAITDGVS